MSRCEHDFEGMFAEHAKNTLANFTKASSFAPAWRAESYLLTPGMPKRIVHSNLQRRRLLLSTDESNTTPVWVAPTELTTQGGDRSGAIPLAPGADPQVMMHAGDVFAVSSVAAWVYVVEEFAR